MTTLAKLLSDELTSDLRWREDELAVMRKQLIESEPGGVRERALLRANVAMLYAHYEGFCKFAIELYLDALEKLKLKRADLRWELATHSLSGFCGELKRESENGKFFEKLMGQFNTELEAIASYDKMPQIANLWPDLLIKWLKRIGLSSVDVESESALLDSLVNNRNQIAHGKKLVIKSRNEFERYSRAAQIVMHHVAIAVVEALEQQTYRRTVMTTTTLNHSAVAAPGAA